LPVSCGSTLPTRRCCTPTDAAAPVHTNWCSTLYCASAVCTLTLALSSSSNSPEVVNIITVRLLATLRWPILKPTYCPSSHPVRPATWLAMATTANLRGCVQITGPFNSCSSARNVGATVCWTHKAWKLGWEAGCSMRRQMQNLGFAIAIS
jgi:hypothetical protein